MHSLVIIVNPVVFLSLCSSLGFLTLLFGCWLLCLLLFFLLSCCLCLLAFLALGLGSWLLLLRRCRLGFFLIKFVLIVVIILFTGASALSISLIHQEKVACLLLETILHRLVLVDSGSEVVGVSAEGDLHELQETIHAAD